MHVLVYLPLLVPVVAASTAWPLARRLPPVVATWLLTGTAVILAAASSVVLGLLTLTALVRIPAVATAAKLSARVVSRDDPASLPVAVAAGALLAVALFAAARALWRRGRALASAYRQARRLPGASQVVVTSDDAADAYTLPGWPCRIVVTSGMVRALSEREQEVLLAHERAHATWFHYLFTSAAKLAAAANPALRPLASAVGYTIERWADERAAVVTGDRSLAARAIARAALASNAAPPRRLWATATLGIATTGPMPRRVSALLSPPPRLRLLLLAGALLLIAVSTGCAMEAARDMHGLLEYAQAAAMR